MSGWPVRHDYIEPTLISGPGPAEPISQAGLSLPGVFRLAEQTNLPNQPGDGLVIDPLYTNAVDGVESPISRSAS
ncbi:hypothetical protein [Corynebacterium cystitidis]|uniref:hypothetical protein n=1 Tax=Corynebacterium cystitidis TaxID=35757 RepID=UPI00211DF27F|nr:hypothetical protein [Corynebacterium cystitidis]